MTQEWCKIQKYLCDSDISDFFIFASFVTYSFTTSEWEIQFDFYLELI